MDRLGKLTVKVRSWMNPETYSVEVEKYGIEFGETITPQLGYQVLWLNWYDMEAIKTLVLHEDPADLLLNFKAWIDTGTEEITINEENYQSFLPLINSWYLERKGNYDVQIID